MQLSLNYSAIGEFYPNPQLSFFFSFFSFILGVVVVVWAVTEDESRALYILGRFSTAESLVNSKEVHPCP